ncbi:MAG TPA: WD40 repeat domain-containing serine/threonine protein kinase, partial [Candidatus Saccharimonadales bacterium]|nr:WD40 repeat domain-containing serine/threonine protein kinase [Candidatus Saccharimonadales bacterium]
MKTAHQCPVCGSELPETRLAGLCPACTWKGLAEPEVEEQTNNTTKPRERDGVLMRVAGYEIIEEIARGAMGIVYRARQLDPVRTVALKMLLPHQLGSSQMAERFRLEVRAMTQLDHPAILPVYEVGEHEPLPFFTMKLATGGTLAARKSAYVGKWRQVAELMATLADAVQFAHEHGVLHRDLKPGNVLFDEAGRPYVSDFGLAKLVDADSNLTRSLEFLGTPNYVAPEVAAQSARQATTASDIYSLGAILYELLAQRPPFEAEGVPALLKKISEDEPTRPGPAVPRDLEVICFKCLAKEPGRRYSSARELEEDLRRWLDGRPILARRATPGERLSAWGRRNPIVASLSLVLAVVVVAGVIMQGRAYHHVSRALQQSRQSEGRATENLHATLLSQARAQRLSGRMGQRLDTLQTIARAARIRGTPELRNEMAAALANPDLRMERSWPVWLNKGRTTIAFSPDLSTYAEGLETGGFVLRSSNDQSEQRRFASGNSRELLHAIFSPDSKFIAAEFYNGAVEVWSRDGKAFLRQGGTAHNRARADFQPRGDAVALQVPGEGVFFQSLSDGERVPLLFSKEPASFLRYEPQGDALAVVRKDAVEVWICTNKTLLWSAPVSNAVAWAAWSPNRRWLLAASDWTQEILA